MTTLARFSAKRLFLPGQTPLLQRNKTNAMMRAQRTEETTMQDAAAESVSPIPAGDWDVQVAIIGGGPGGEDCARDLADHGIKVAMINNAPLPGGGH